MRFTDLHCVRMHNQDYFYNALVTAEGNWRAGCLRRHKLKFRLRNAYIVLGDAGKALLWW